MREHIYRAWDTYAKEYPRHEFYSWVTIQEAIELRDELNRVIRKAANV